MPEKPDKPMTLAAIYAALEEINQTLSPTAPDLRATTDEWNDWREACAARLERRAKLWDAVHWAPDLPERDKVSPIRQLLIMAAGAHAFTAQNEADKIRKRKEG